MVNRLKLPAALSALLLAACSQQQAPDVADNTVVIFAGQSITTSQLEVAAQRSLGRPYDSLDQAMQQQLIDSLISAQAMASLAEQSLTEDDMQRLDYQVAAYKQEQLVKLYLQEYAIPQPVSQQQVEQYYAEHPHEFGGGYIADVSLLQCQISDSEVCLPKMKLERLQEWKETTAYNSRFARISLNSLIEADSSLLKLAKNTGAENYSSIKTDKDSITRLYVHSVTEIAPEPLATVSTKIRERLAPQQLKKAIREAAAKARAAVQSQTN